MESGTSANFSAESTPRAVLFLAGDVSGDLYSARLAAEVHTRCPHWHLHALGGPHLGQAIAGSDGEWIADTSGCSAIGIASVLGISLRAVRLATKMRRFVVAHHIDAVVMCDWGGFNCGQLRFFKKRGIPVLYYFPPRSWQRSGVAGLAIAPLVTRVATPFAWSARRLAAAGCEAEWVGHPLMEISRDATQRAALRTEFGVRESEKLIALLPGSRKTELRVLAPRMALAAEILRREQHAKFVVAIPKPLLTAAREIFPASMSILSGRAADALLACDAAIVKTGTATLEAAVIGAPQVAVYDLSWSCRLEWLLLWMWKKIPFIALPNIILQRMAVPELLGLDCRPEAMALSIAELLENDLLRARMQTDYEEIRLQLGAALSPKATPRTAEILLEMISGRSSTAQAQTSIANFKN